eukprot:Blabericola_migrator_1__7047@NODE_3575_length_1665_cov_1006_074468_g2186_i1_p1_GENE_NODE_3575_length_1665_cov_1006_074468_g2186_i1NODE_3575_length_1665_cov_1006_074468_g2186_i1_p1_ORF_typecomplete_len459_score87_94Filament/PF00038_21/0_0011Filament/PF00038_21/0_57MAD/PF05557_13/0_00022Pep1_7/PF17232_2/0_0016TPR_12/PF13424_6/0_14TPR_12/PF13424_6/35Myosin_tail_1/PF01576_19/0_013Golgin_A5/PF09787_9/2_3Golgin_A5/PF09787_9/0_0042Golgin_A5/PF09787_9/2_1e03DUF4201/PF13870_6/0_0047DUF4201/PF13870_6/38DU
MRIHHSILFSLLASSCLADVAVESSPPAPPAPCVCDSVKSEAEAACKTQVTSLTKEHGARLQECQQSLKTFEASLAATKTTLASAQSDLSTSQTSLASLRVENKRLSESKSSLEAKVAALSADTSKAQEVEQYKQKVASLTSQVQSLQADLQARVQAHQTEAAARAAAEASVAELKRAVSSTQAVSQQLSECQVESSRLKSSVDSLAQEHSAQRKLLQNELSVVQSSMEAMKAAHEKNANEIYNTEQLSRHMKQFTTIGTAYAKVLRNVLVNLVGQNNYDLVILQATMLGHTVYDKADIYTQGAREKARQLYNQHLRERLSPMVEQAKGYYGVASSYVKDRAQSLVVVVDVRLNAFVDRLSKIDPEVRSMFPEAFADRCVAFAFMAAVLYIVSEPLSMLLNIVRSVLARLLGLSSSSEKSSKSRRSSRSLGKTTKSASTASTKTSTSKKGTKSETVKR